MCRAVLKRIGKSLSIFSPPSWHQVDPALEDPGQCGFGPGTSDGATCEVSSQQTLHCVGTTHTSWSYCGLNLCLELDISDVKGYFGLAAHVCLTYANPSALQLSHSTQKKVEKPNFNPGKILAP